MRVLSQNHFGDRRSFRIGVRKTTSAPSFEQATVASMNPRWLRHMIASLSRWSMDSDRKACASESVRR
jgi:hypothetical protein